MNHHGLGAALIGAKICQEAERLKPGQFKAISFRQGCLHLQLSRSQLLDFKMNEGNLINLLRDYCSEHNLPSIQKFRLTIQEE